MKILVVGSGAREHAIVHSLAQESPAGGQHELHAAPGNPGIAGLATLHHVDALDGQAVAELALLIGAELVVVGPEAPLVAGVADAVRAAGIPVFGPSADAARLEGSKAFAKEVMAAAGVPTAQAVVCSTLEQVGAALDEFGAPYVVKDDGLAAGKGVVVTDDRAAALAHAAECFANPDRGGDPRVVIEEFLDGPEVSLFCISDGQSVVPLAPAQDFKRAFDGDNGPNTGGMGAYSPLPWAPVGLVEQVVQTVAQPTIDEMAARGTPFAGVLYVGLALTSKGPRVIEFNARFGDPETQVVLSRLVTPLSELLLAASTGTLAGLPALQWSDNAAVTVVVASNGYPAAPTYGDPITGVAEADALPGVHVLHAGTAVSGTGGLVSAGGRVLSVVGVGADLRAARRLAYAGVQRIALRGSHHRSDIAETAAAGVQLGSDALDLAGWRHIYSGKVRDLYEPDLAHYGGVHPLGDVLLVVASDRVSAHDFILSPGIPDKGTILTQLSLWWFEQLSDLVGNHVVSTEISAMPGDGLVPDEVAGRAMICRRLEMFPVECVARGYLTGSGLVEYRANRSVCGVELPDGLVDGSRLPAPIFTPATKAEVGEHDENVSFEVVAAQLGEASATRLRELTLAVYARAEQIARARGVILADTKLEFGIDPATGEIVLGDEVLTPDSSRFWALDTWQPGQSQPSFDKQPIRDWLVSPDSGWDRTGEQPPPELPDAVVDATRDRYLAAYWLLTGDKLSEHVRRP